MAAFSMIRLLPVLVIGFFGFEIASVILVGQYLGVFTTLLLIIADFILGVSIIRTAGANALSEIRTPFRTPGSEAKLAGGMALRVVAGLLFVIPGFFSDLLAVLALSPPVKTWLSRRFKLVARSSQDSWIVQTHNRYSMSCNVIEGEVVDVGSGIAPPPSNDQGSRSNQN